MKNSNAYYRAIENMINFSDRKSHMFSIFHAELNGLQSSFILEREHYQLVNPPEVKVAKEA